MTRIIRFDQNDVVQLRDKNINCEYYLIHLFSSKIFKTINSKIFTFTLIRFVVAREQSRFKHEKQFDEF